MSKELARVDAFWRAANYLSVGQMYLRENPLLLRELRRTDLKPTLLGHWGTVPGQTFIYAHLNRIIRERDANVMYISGPGHGGQAMVACAYLEGTYSEIYPSIRQDLAGLKRICTQYAYPGGIPSHVSPECPGSIHEGGELGYSLSHAFGAAFDNPDLVVACVIGDGEAETGPLATGWHGNKFLNPATDGAVLPILHLNGYKIANPTLLGRLPREELSQLLRGYGYTPFFVEGDEPQAMHRLMAATLDEVFAEIADLQRAARRQERPERPHWPMIVLRTPKGWTGPEEVVGSFRSHQVPLAMATRDPAHLRELEDWLRSYRPEELFRPDGTPRPPVLENAPAGNRRMSANPHANGGSLLRELDLPDYRDYAVDVPAPGEVQAADTNVLAGFLRDIIRRNEEQANFRIFGPDEVLSNRLAPVFEVTDRQWMLPTRAGDEHLAPHGRVVEMLSEHQCQGWLEGYLLTGRHGLFTSYEAFIHIVDSMVSQHAKWLKVCAELQWRAPIASLNYLLASHVWQQAHNGFTHQDPGFIDHVVNKKAAVVRVYLPPDANCLLSVWNHCQRSRDYVNVVIAGKYQAPQWLTIGQAEDHCRAGIATWEWASNHPEREPDVVLACCGDVPTLETLAAASILYRELPELAVRVVNVVDVMKLQSEDQHPHGLSDADYDALFTRDRPVIFAFHGYPFLIHRLAYRRAGHAHLHVHGYLEEGTITTYFDMAVLNRLDRFNLVRNVLKRIDAGPAGEELDLRMSEKLARHRRHIRSHGVDMPEVRNWTWAGTQVQAER
jgi:xylulose-5-phosphate/fructose-6-phosphate phosphoketolase